jgi:DtxR family Mn-dependent transcriptional regulator
MIFLGTLPKTLRGSNSECQGQVLKIEKQYFRNFENQKGICVGVKDTSSEFLKYLDKQEIALGSEIEIIERKVSSFRIRVGIKEITVSNKIASNLYIK